MHVMPFDYHSIATHKRHRLFYTTYSYIMYLYIHCRREEENAEEGKFLSVYVYLMWCSYQLKMVL